MIYAFSELESVTQDIYASWLYLASADRRARTLRYAFYKDRLLCLSAYVLLCFALKKERAEFIYGRHGKPSLASGGPCFNMTHCDGMTACAVSGEPIGIDAERISAYPRDILHHVFTHRESQLIFNSEHPDRMFYTLWTLKESYVKALGHGLGFPLRDVEFLEAGDAILCSDKRFVFSSHALGAHIISSCGARAQPFRVVGLKELCGAML